MTHPLLSRQGASREELLLPSQRQPDPAAPHRRPGWTDRPERPRLPPGPHSVQRRNRAPARGDLVRVAGDADVSRIVSLARETGLELAGRSGGHSIPGHSVSEGGLVLDLSDMRALDVDVEGRTVWAEAGLTAGELTNAPGPHGLAVGFGHTGSVGIGGITLGGDIGYLVRRFGLTIDDLLAADVVTANGEIRRVNSESEPDLFWAIRGGGGNFGVVTRFRYRLYELETVVGGMLLLPATPDTTASFIAEGEAAPEELSRRSPMS